MKTYPVHSSLFDGKHRYLPGDTVELDDDEARRLQQIGVVGDAEEDRSHAERWNAAPTAPAVDSGSDNIPKAKAKK